MHARLADEARLIPSEAPIPYLDIPAIVQIAWIAGATPYTPATASLPRTPRLPGPASSPISPSSDRQPRRSPPWATRSNRGVLPPLPVSRWSRGQMDRSRPTRSA
jgi:hypothetical protein